MAALTAILHQRGYLLQAPTTSGSVGEFKESRSRLSLEAGGG